MDESNLGCILSWACHTTLSEIVVAISHGEKLKTLAIIQPEMNFNLEIL